MSRLTPTPRTSFGRHRERGGHDRELLHAILDAATVCHFGIVLGSGPMVVPTVFGREGDTVYVHGSVASRSLVAAGGGLDICLTVSVVDGIVLARSVFEHSINYRSAMVYGRTRLVSDAAEKLVALRAVTDHVCPGQWDYARRPSRKELAATTVIAVPLQEASCKVRDGGPGDSDGPDAELPIWAGVVPVRTVFGEPIDDPAAVRRVDVPAHVRGLAGLTTEERHAPLRH